jgi:hypothetical protein
MGTPVVSDIQATIKSLENATKKLVYTRGDVDNPTYISWARSLMSDANRLKSTLNQVNKIINEDDFDRE